MPVISRHTVIAAALVAGAALSWWLANSVDVINAPPPPLQARHIADYSMDDFTLSAMDETGRLHYRLHAAHMSHYLDDDTSSLRRPDMTLYRRGAGTWNAVAQHGWLGSAQKNVVLTGDVLVWRDAAKAGDGMEMETDRLHITPDQEYAETDRPVTITQSFGVTHAVGMRVSLKENRMELLNAVRGRYMLKSRCCIESRAGMK